MEKKEKIPKKEGLSPKRKRFADEYLIDLNGKQAAIRAGYSPKTANEQAARMLANVNVKDYVASRMTEREKRIEADQDFVVNTILETVALCRQQRVATDRMGNALLDENGKIVLVPVDAANALKGSELLGRHLGIFERDNKQRRPLASASDEELLEKLKEIQAKTKASLKEAPIPIRKVA